MIPENLLELVLNEDALRASPSQKKFMRMRIEDILERNINDLHKSNLKHNASIYICKQITNLKLNNFFPKQANKAATTSYDLISKLNLTTDATSADFFLVPHEWVNIYRNKNYVSYLKDLSAIAPIVILNTGDRSPYCNLPNTIQIRTFLHPGENQKYKIIIPYPVKKKEFTLRSWKPNPSISFVGYVPTLGFGNLTTYNPKYLIHPWKSSYYLNRIIAIKKLSRMHNYFDIINIRRNSFTLRIKNSQLEKHVTEYEASLKNSDYVVCPRGFANTSMRLYESLSSGATPILIDSGTPLPFLSNGNFWDQNLLHVKLFSDWGKAILEDWNFLKANGNYRKRQVENFETYTRELAFDKYVSSLFQKYLK